MALLAFFSACQRRYLMFSPLRAKRTIYGVHRAGNKRGFRPGKPRHHSRHFFRSAVTFYRHKAVHQFF